MALLIDLLFKAVNGFSDFDGSQLGRSLLCGGLDHCISCLSSCSACKIGLMLFALRVSQVAALVGVESKTQSALIGADVVPHEIRIFGDIYGL